MLRALTHIMTNVCERVPIPKNGVDYRGKIVLAPMVRSGELPSRLLALKYGADLVWGPETIDKALIGTTRRINTVTNTVDFTRFSSNGAKNPDVNPDQRESIIYRLHPSREGRQLIYQIGTSNPDTAVEAAKLIAGDVAGIDVNAGCPKPFSTSGGMGAALLKTPDLLCDILRALVSEVGNPFEIGISVKIRLLETPEQTETLVRKLCATGITGLTVHCRTTPMRPRERAIRQQLPLVRRLCHEAGIACLMNGDVTSRDEALQLMKEYGVDGAMIATAAETNSSCFRANDDGGMAPWTEVVAEYVKMALEVENRYGNTKYLLGQMIPGKSPVYRQMTQCKSYSELVKALGYGDELSHLAQEVDQKLDIGTSRKTTKAERKMQEKASKKAQVNGAFSRKRQIEATATHQAQPQAIKRKADAAELDEMPADIARETGPGTLSEQASVLAV
ncbi:hypothetical protein BT93_L4891 [Corymbia citriodora subsp. variegata]|uniref:DUS-like FMN-binding domain-containing protein n=1 Tax=Corymbia citriodora subsp. variegata TaxID=360336 RepID=A0A8T0CK95_CORYI|nr:hypothetical protein BT93_L4891 [Corymbia citriodora subsp. variegata]